LELGTSNGPRRIGFLPKDGRKASSRNVISSFKILKDRWNLEKQQYLTSQGILK
jgi:hypothetical protein